jgi:hypothetical protein
MIELLQADILSFDELPHSFFRDNYYMEHIIHSLNLWLQLSYQIVDSFVWLGIRDMINDLRKRKLKLRPVTYLSGTHAYSNNIPHAYIWSPYLVPKPKGLNLVL